MNVGATVKRADGIRGEVVGRIHVGPFAGCWVVQWCEARCLGYVQDGEVEVLATLPGAVLEDGSVQLELFGGN